MEELASGSPLREGDVRTGCLARAWFKLCPSAGVSTEESGSCGPG